MNTSTHVHDVRTGLPRIIYRCSVISGIKDLSGVNDIFCISKRISVEMIQAKALQTLNHALDVETSNVQ